MSTPRSTRAWATSSFSVMFMLAPGDCSPSRSVVSKILMYRSAVMRIFSSWRMSDCDLYWVRGLTNARWGADPRPAR